MLLAAMNDVSEALSGLASGIVNTAFMMGGALGLAILASLADLHTQQLRAVGTAPVAALNEGYQLAFLIGAGLTALGALLCALLLRPKPQPAGAAVVAH